MINESKILSVIARRLLKYYKFCNFMTLQLITKNIYALRRKMLWFIAQNVDNLREIFEKVF